jgi:hypothetical protein
MIDIRRNIYQDLIIIVVGLINLLVKGIIDTFYYFYWCMCVCVYMALGQCIECYMVKLYQRI